MAKPKIRLLLVDDHLVVRIGLRSLLEMQPDMTVVAEAASGAAAVKEFERHRPDLTLMDLRMPGMDGAQATAAIRALAADARILVITTFDTDEDIFRALQSGACGYLLKNTDSEPLLKTIRSVHAGTYQLPPAVATRLAQRQAAPELSPREREVLELIVRGRSNKEIGSALGVAENTVKNHVKVILDKLGVQDRTQAATTAIQRGIVRL
ncbi:MAG: DNA-binding response regulator [Proteobacteria bacterium]|jgi:DNA-binding NarL/FixJ family response regulator|nr:DNA-binding response regulator [Pseudomonadota bacterium]